MNVWFTARGAGLSALILLTLSTSLGALVSRHGGAATAGRRYVGSTCTGSFAGLGRHRAAAARRHDPGRLLRARRLARGADPVHVGLPPDLGGARLAGRLHVPGRGACSAWPAGRMAASAVGARVWRGAALAGLRLAGRWRWCTGSPRAPTARSAGCACIYLACLAAVGRVDRRPSGPGCAAVPAPPAGRAGHPRRSARGRRHPSAAGSHPMTALLHRTGPLPTTRPARRSRPGPSARPALLAGLDRARQPRPARPPGHRTGRCRRPTWPGCSPSSTRVGTLAGRGGAGFSFAAKLRALAAGSRRVVVNGSESEPASHKDRVLLRRTPHLVLDGALAVAAAVGARDGRRRGARRRHAPPPSARAVGGAARRRPACGSARSTAASSPARPAPSCAALDGGPALPPGRRTPPTANGTLRLERRDVRAGGACCCAWARSASPTPARPTSPAPRCSRSAARSRRPGVVEIPLGTPLGIVLAAAGAAEQPQAVVIGGYHGTWLAPIPRSGCPAPGSRAAGGTLGAGVLIVLDQDTCALGELGRVTGWLAGESARQCGPVPLRAAGAGRRRRRALPPATPGRRRRARGTPARSTGAAPARTPTARPASSPRGCTCCRTRPTGTSRTAAAAVRCCGLLPIGGVPSMNARRSTGRAATGTACAPPCCPNGSTVDEWGFPIVLDPARRRRGRGRRAPRGRGLPRPGPAPQPPVNSGEAPVTSVKGNR